MPYFVYILANRPNGTLYVGSTSDLAKRIYQHKNKFVAGFTSRYSISSLVYFEEYQEVTDMAQREKRLLRVVPRLDRGIHDHGICDLSLGPRGQAGLVA